MVKNQRCKHILYDKINGKKRLCKNKSTNNSNFCHIHMKTIYTNNIPDYLTNEYNKCCFCNEECNPSSQTCGRCARIATSICIGHLLWN